MLINARCPIETTLSLVGGKWKLLIIRSLYGGKKRYGELQAELGYISPKVLSSQLNEMIADHLIKKTVYPVVPPKTEYELAPIGISLLPVLGAMKAWGEDFKQKLASGQITDFYDRLPDDMESQEKTDFASGKGGTSKDPGPINTAGGIQK